MSENRTSSTGDSDPAKLTSADRPRTRGSSIATVHGTGSQVVRLEFGAQCDIRSTVNEI